MISSRLEKRVTDCIVAYAYSSNHREQLLKDRKCGCFFCLEIFDSGEIKEWVKDTKM